MIRGRLMRPLMTGLLAAAMASMGVVVAPSAIAAPNLEQVRLQVQDLESKAESATERYNQARNELADVQQTLATLKAKVRRERKELRSILGSVDDLARATYTSGGIDTSLQVLLAEDPNEFLAQAAALDQVQQGQASALRRTQTTRLRLAQSEAAVADKERIASRARKNMSDSKKEADGKLAEAQALLNSLEQKQRDRLAAMARAERQAAISAAAAASAAISASSGSGSGSAGGGYTGGGRAARAVQYALSQVGDRYVAAAAGPSSFDCSGLTMQAWRQAGISLPHYSRSQFSVTRRVPLSQAQPGDLVFYFGSGAHHVGMYIGNGKMVHAANPRTGVVVTSVLGPWYSSRFSGVGRVVG
ncbi:MAG: NlpC/P60 family protein [Candidatus Nanopelagicales bacterium]|nr:NlpC/P60 family protein [Candidatus Nanopelagicales bacterium]